MNSFLAQRQTCATIIHGIKPVKSHLLTSQRCSMGAMATPSGETTKCMGFNARLPVGCRRTCCDEIFHSRCSSAASFRATAKTWATSRGGDPPQGLHKYRNRLVWPDSFKPQTSTFMTIISNTGPLMKGKEERSKQLLVCTLQTADGGTEHFKAFL